jgi:plastocyanin
MKSIVRDALTTALAAVVSIGCAAAAPSNVAPSVMSLPSASPATASATALGTSVTVTSIEAASAPPGAIAVQAGEGPIFRPSALETPTGDFQIFLTSPPVDPSVQRATDGHNIGIRAPGSLNVIASSDYVRPGDPSIVFTVSGLEPGTYKFICEFRDHAGGGMYGTLTVAGG